MKNIIIAVLLLIIAGGVAYWYFSGQNKEETPPPPEEEVIEVPNEEEKEYEVIGTSVEDREIHAYRFGEGENHIVLVGAIHGGYEWNTASLAYDMIDYFTEDPSLIPSDMSVTVIPVANPDGLHKVVGTSERFEAADAPQFEFANEVKLTDTVVDGRFNANGVDLNRNFDCKWQENATWREFTIGGGSAPFSEPETTALRDFFLEEEPTAAVFYHSASNGIYTSFCEDMPLAETTELMEAYAEAADYQTFDDYVHYEVTGDAADWLSTIGIPGITVELSTHEVIEFEKNLAGVEAMFALYSSEVE